MNVLLLMVLATGLATQPAAAVPSSGPPLSGAAAEEFLRTAEVVAMKPIGNGVSRPYKVTLSDGTRTLAAVWKTIDEFEMSCRLDRGKPVRDFRDSFKHEVAAYELDKLLGLGMVPPTVERTIHHERGSLQLWVNGCISERERLDTNQRPPNLTRWNQQIYTVRLFHQLIADLDYNNVRNLLVEPTFKIWIIDSSRGFRLDPNPRKVRSLRLVARPLLERLEALTEEELTARMGDLLSIEQIRALLSRRDRIVAHARSGDGVVLFP